MEGRSPSECLENEGIRASVGRFQQLILFSCIRSYLGRFKRLPFLSIRVMIDFIVISGVLSFTFGLQDCERYSGNIVIPWIVQPGFCSIYFTVTFAGLKNVNRYIGNIVLSKIVISGFHCIRKRIYAKVINNVQSGSVFVLLGKLVPAETRNENLASDP